MLRITPLARALFLTLWAVLLHSLVPVAVAQERKISLPSPGFEESSPAQVSATLQSMELTDGKRDPSVPAGWSAYQWGLNKMRYAVAVEPGAGRSGAALRARNIDVNARAGVYMRATLQPGAYRLSAWARAAKGRTSAACIHLGGRNSRVVALDDQWRQISVMTVIPEAHQRVEVSVQNCSGDTDDVWFDDAELVFLKTVTVRTVPDTRLQRPRTLLFSPINVNYLRETAPDWAKRGFRGFLLDGVMKDIITDVWAVDGKPDTRGEDDALLREVKACNDACRAVGIDSNFVKVAFYSPLPSPFNDQAWANITRNFAEAATFAIQSGCAGVAIDTEYVAGQYNPKSPVYEGIGRKPAEIARKYRERLEAITTAMLDRNPTMVLLTLPEGIKLYKAYYRSIFEGMLEACAKVDAPGGLHVLTEETYHLTSPTLLANYAEDLQALTLERIAPALHDYWTRRCTIAMGAWPLGYYRTIVDDRGVKLGYGGRKETFGDKVVGSYADRSAWYPPETFRQQMAGLNAYSARFNWIYAHGSSFWSLTPEQMARYKAGVHKPMGDTNPTVTNLADYFEVLAKPSVVQND